MKTTITGAKPVLLALRWIARVSSLVFIGVFILMFIGEGFYPAQITPREWVSLFIFPFALVVGMILAWWKEGLGGAIMVLSVLTSIILFGASAPGGAYMLVCASPGVLFLLCWIMSKMAVHPTDA